MKASRTHDDAMIDMLQRDPEFAATYLRTGMMLCHYQPPGRPGNRDMRYPDALVNAREAIECHLEGLLPAGEALPQPGSTDVHRQAPEYAEGTWVRVDIDLSRLDSKVRCINISMPERVLAVIDEEARRSGETRSGFLAKAAFEYIDRHRRAS